MKYSLMISIAIICVSAYAVFDLKDFHDHVRGNNYNQVSATLVQYPKAIAAKNDEGETALHIAALESDWGMVNLLIRHRKDMVDETDMYGETPLFKAVLRGCRWKVQALIDAGANVNILRRADPEKRPNGSYRYTSLQLACVLGHVDVIQALLNARADGTIQGDIESPSSLVLRYHHDNRELLGIFDSDNK